VKYTSSQVRFVAFDNSLDAWVPEVWAAESLAILEENMVIGNLVYREFSNQVQDYGDTVNSRRPSEYVAKRKGANDDVTVQASAATNVAVVLNQHIHTSFIIKDSEQSLSFEDLIRVHIKPAAQSIARKIDKILMGQVYQFLGNSVGQLEGLAVANVKRRLLELGQKMDENKCYEDGRNLIVTPGTKTDILELDLFNAANTIGDNGTALRKASLGELLNFNVLMAQNAPSVLAAAFTLNADELSADEAAGQTVLSLDSGAVAPVCSYVTIEGDLQPMRVVAVNVNDITVNRALRTAVLAAASDLNVVTMGEVDLAGHTGVSAYPAGYDKEIKVDGTGIPHVGQLVSFGTAGAPNVIKAGEYSIIDVTISGGAYYIELDRGLDVELVNNDVVGYGPAGAYNFAFHRDALAMVVRPLAPPKPGAGAVSGIADYNNLAMRVTISYEGRGQGHLVTLDVLFGTKVLDTNLGAAFLA